MIPYALWLQYIVCLNPEVGLSYDFVTNHATVIDCGDSLYSGNRVCHDEVLTEQDVQQVKDHFGRRLYSWYVHVNDLQSQELLLSCGLKYRTCFSFFMKDLDFFEVVPCDSDIQIQEIFDEDQICSTWAVCCTHAFHPANAALKLDKTIAVVKNLLSKKSKSLHFYFGYYQSKVVGVCMSVHHGNVVSLHKLATLQEFRRKGLGFAMMQQALVDAKMAGCSKAILMATESGMSLYKRLGFLEYAKYNAYGNEN